MSNDDICPNIETVFHYRDYDFTFIVVAYRKVTPQEGKLAFRKYLSSIHRKYPPKGKTVKFQTLIGYFSEEFF